MHEGLRVRKSCAGPEICLSRHLWVNLSGIKERRVLLLGFWQQSILLSIGSRMNQLPNYFSAAVPSGSLFHRINLCSIKRCFYSKWLTKEEYKWFIINKQIINKKVMSITCRETMFRHWDWIHFTDASDAGQVFTYCKHSDTVSSSGNQGYSCNLDILLLKIPTSQFTLKRCSTLLVSIQ